MKLTVPLIHLPRQSYLTKAGTKTVMHTSRIKARPRDPLEDEAARMADALDVVGGTITKSSRRRKLYNCVKCFYE